MANQTNFCAVDGFQFDRTVIVSRKPAGTSDTDFLVCSNGFIELQQDSFGKQPLHLWISENREHRSLPLLIIPFGLIQSLSDLRNIVSGGVHGFQLARFSFVAQVTLFAEMKLLHLRWTARMLCSFTPAFMKVYSNSKFGQSWIHEIQSSKNGLEWLVVQTWFLCNG